MKNQVQVTSKAAALIIAIRVLDEEITHYRDKLEYYAELPSEERTQDILEKEDRAKELVAELTMRLFNLRKVETLKLEYGD